MKKVYCVLPLETIEQIIESISKLATATSADEAFELSGEDKEYYGVIELSDLNTQQTHTK